MSTYVRLIADVTLLHCAPLHVQFLLPNHLRSQKASEMTMDHVPFHEEVREFTQLVADACGPDYEVASEHAHSCCMLVRRHQAYPTVALCSSSLQALRPHSCRSDWTRLDEA